MADAKQRRALEKKKKRERIRQKHLEEAQQRRDSELTRQPIFNPRPVQLSLPHRNDRVGWNRANTVTRENIFAEVRKMYPADKLLWRFLRHEHVSKHDLHYISDLMTKAAQKLCCDPPYYVPFVEVTKDAFAIASMKLEKTKLVVGSAWHFEQDGYRWRTIVDNKGLLFAMSTHAVDRLYKRLKPLHMNKIIGALVNLLPLQAIMVDGCWVVPLYKLKLAANFGYCPIDIQGGLAVAKSFLLPFMRGTPEWEALKTAGRHDLLHDDFKDMEELAKFAEKAGPVLAALYKEKNHGIICQRGEGDGVV